MTRAFDPAPPRGNALLHCAGLPTARASAGRKAGGQEVGMPRGWGRGGAGPNSRGRGEATAKLTPKCPGPGHPADRCSETNNKLTHQLHDGRPASDLRPCAAGPGTMTSGPMRAHRRGCPANQHADSESTDQSASRASHWLGQCRPAGTRVKPAQHAFRLDRHPASRASRRFAFQRSDPAI